MARVIQVGLGLWGLNWAEEVFPQVPAAEPVALVDPSPEALERAQASLGVAPSACFASLNDALKVVEADLVIATVRTQAHHPVVMEALEAGFHVLVEKPFASTIAEAEEMVAAAEAAGRVLMVNQNYRFHPAPIHVAELVARRALGRVNLVSLDFRRHGPSQGYRYWDMPHPLIADMSIHHFDLMRMVLGSDPRRVTCRTWNFGGTPFVYDPLGVATVEFEDASMVSYRGSWVSGGENTAWAGEWAMDCAEGEIRWMSRDHDRGLVLNPDRVTVKRLGEPASAPKLPPLEFVDRAGSLAAMLEAIEGREPPRFSSGRDNLMSLALVEAAILSAARDGEWVDIAEIFA